MNDQVPLHGTYRALLPSETWARASSWFDHVGLTRVSDVTGLDCIGIPVAMAVRPDAATLAVAQGKGATLELAKVSAAMESLELWHAEQACDVAERATARQLELPYSTRSLPGRRLATWDTDDVVLDWVWAQGLVSGTPILIPLDSVRLTLSDRHDAWAPNVLGGTSNGLASGNTRPEAALHGLLELVERHATGGLRPGRLDVRRHVEPESIPQEHVQHLLTALRRADVELELSFVPTALGASCFTAHIWSYDYPVICAGAGCHIDSAVAVSRAVTEAAQTRLTQIAGTRDDIASASLPSWAKDPALRTQGGEKWDQLHFKSSGFGSFEGSVATLAAEVRNATGAEPIIYTYPSPIPNLSFVRVLAPGLGHGDLHSVPI